jgi:hypothetical protein
LLNIGSGLKKTQRGLNCKLTCRHPCSLLSDVTRRLIAILLMLWFPLQGWAAFAMPACRHAMDATAVADEPPAGAAPAVETEAHCHPPTTVSSAVPCAGDHGQCDQCAACHFAHPSSLTHLPLVLLGDPPPQRAESVAVFYYQRFPERPQRPPLVLA